MALTNPRKSLPDNAPVIPPQEGRVHGYWGVTPQEESDEEYTFAGAAAETEQANQAEQQEPARADEKTSRTQQEQGGTERKGRST